MAEPSLQEVQAVGTHELQPVAVIDLKTLEVIGKIATGTDPDGLAWAQR